MTIKNSIGWCDTTINPIKGKCGLGCWYCYYSGEHGIMNRFRLDLAVRLDLSVFKNIPKKAKRAFLCSTHEIFGEWIPKDWRNQIFEEICRRPDLTFIILTKMPEQIDRSMPKNVHLGVSVTCRADLWRIDALSSCQTAVSFVSFEPLLEPVVPPNGIFSGLKWAVIGKLTAHGKKHDPQKSDLDLMINGAQIFNVPIFMKENLKNIWKGQLIQEYP